MNSLLPSRTPRACTGSSRHARLTAAGTLMVAHIDSGKLSEYNISGKELWSLPAPGISVMTPLKNGNYLISGSFGVREVNRQKETVWSLTKNGIPGL